MLHLEKCHLQVIKDPNAGPDEKYGPGSQYTGVALLDTIDGTDLHFQFVMNEQRDGKKSRIRNSVVYTVLYSSQENLNLQLI